MDGHQNPYARTLRRIKTRTLRLRVSDGSARTWRPPQQLARTALQPHRTTPAAGGRAQSRSTPRSGVWAGAGAGGAVRWGYAWPGRAWPGRAGPGRGAERGLKGFAAGRGI